MLEELVLEGFLAWPVASALEQLLVVAVVLAGLLHLKRCPFLEKRLKSTFYKRDHICWRNIITFLIKYQLSHEKRSIFSKDLKKKPPSPAHNHQPWPEQPTLLDRVYRNGDRVSRDRPWSIRCRTS